MNNLEHLNKQCFKMMKWYILHLLISIFVLELIPNIPNSILQMAVLAFGGLTAFSAIYSNLLFLSINRIPQDEAQYNRAMALCNECWSRLHRFSPIIWLIYGFKK